MQDGCAGVAPAPPNLVKSCEGALRDDEFSLACAACVLHKNKQDASQAADDRRHGETGEEEVNEGSAEEEGRGRRKEADERERHGERERERKRDATSDTACHLGAGLPK